MFGPLSTPSCASQAADPNATNFISPSGTVPSRNNPAPGPVAILWDMENCAVPKDVPPEDVAGNIRMAIRDHPVIQGAVKLFAAYGDFTAFTKKVREGCQRTGVKLVDVPNGRKDAADKAILVDMFLFALDNPPPSSIMLISGDVDFAPALHILGQRGYTVILVIPSGVGVSSPLYSAGEFVANWSSVAHGEGFVASAKNPISPHGGSKDGSRIGYHVVEKTLPSSNSCVLKAATAGVDKSQKALRPGKLTSFESQSPSGTSSEDDHLPDIVDSSKSMKDVGSAPNKVSQGPKKDAAAQAAKPMNGILPQKSSTTCEVRSFSDASSEGLKNCVSKTAPGQACSKQTQAILPQESTASKPHYAKKRGRKWVAVEPSLDADIPLKMGGVKVIDGVTLSSPSKSPDLIIMETNASSDGEIHTLRSKKKGWVCARAVKRANAKILATDKGNTVGGLPRYAISIRKSEKAKQAVEPKQVTLAPKSSTTPKTQSAKKPSGKETATRNPCEGLDTRQTSLRIDQTEVSKGVTLGTPNKCDATRNGTVMKFEIAESHLRPQSSANSHRRVCKCSAKNSVDEGFIFIFAIFIIFTLYFLG